MKILMVFHNAPNAPPLDLGPAKRSFPFFLESAKRHSIWMVSLGMPEEEKRFRDRFGSMCREAIFINQRRPKLVRIVRWFWYLLSGKSLLEYLFRNDGVQAAIDDVCRRERFDLIYCTTSHLGWYRFPDGVPKVADSHNVEYDLVRRTFQQTRNLAWKLFYYIQYHRAYRDELRNNRKFDIITTTTDRDRELYLRDMPGLRLATIQNGVGQSFFENIAAPFEPHTMLFMGLMNYEPNRNGLFYFVNDILPLVLKSVPDAKLYVVGAQPARDILRLANSSIIVTGFVDDVRPYIARTEVFVIPLKIGGGIRGKALEAMAMKKAIITTHIGCEGIKLEHNDSALFADSPEDFAAAIVRVMRDPALAARLGRKAYENVFSAYNWEAKGLELERVFQDAVTLHRNDGRDAVETSRTVEVQPRTTQE